MTHVYFIALLALGSMLQATAHKFSVSSRRNESHAEMVQEGGCAQTVYWPGTTFQNGQWSYAGYLCDSFWAYDYVVNVTAQPHTFGWNTIGPLFQYSNVTLSNLGTCTGFDYTVTIINPQLNDKDEVCSGTVNPGESIPCTIMTVPGQFSYIAYYFVDINIRNPSWVCNADGDIQITQSCQNGNAAGADLCSNGTFYGFVDPMAPEPILNYVTGSQFTFRLVAWLKLSMFWVSKPEVGLDSHWHVFRAR